MTANGEALLSDGRPVEIPSSKFYDFTSAATGREYRLYVYVPEADPPEGGFPVLYVLDGGWWFATVVEAVRSRSLGFEISPAVVVGIGYRTMDWMTSGALRFKDLSTPAPQAWLDAMAFPIPGLTADMTGGMDAFIETLEQEIKPGIARLAPINTADQSLFGHSLGGLTVLRALFRAPASFRTFMASSPSIWWNDNAILADEAAFAEAVRARRAEPRVLIDVGGLEQTPSSAALRVMKTEAAVQAAVTQSRMVDNARELGARLSALKGGPAYVTATVVFPDEGHGSVVAAALGRAITLALATG